MLMTMLSCFGVNWKISEIGGVKYVPLVQVGEFFNLEKIEDEEGDAVLRNKELTLRFLKGAKDAILNNVKFKLKHPVEVVEGAAFLSNFDLVKMIDPVLRPSKVTGLQGVKTVFLDPAIDREFRGKDAIVNEMAEALKRRGFEVVVLEAKGERMRVAEQLRKIGEGERGIFLQLELGGGKKSLMRTTTVGSNLEPSVAMSTALHWTVIQRLSGSGTAALTIGDQGISIGDQAGYEKLTIPGARVVLRLDKALASRDILGRGIADALFFARKAGGELARPDEKK
ncbi:MAG: hypothetical protein ACJAQT_000978 [Akkermansiaceae bacterium]|jgi:hypothetical protein